MDQAYRSVKTEWRFKHQEPPLRTQSSGQADGKSSVNVPSSSEEVASSLTDGTTMPSDVHCDGPAMPNDVQSDSPAMANNVQSDGASISNDVHSVPKAAMAKNMHYAVSTESLSSTDADSTEATDVGSNGTPMMGN